MNPPTTKVEDLQEAATRRQNSPELCERIWQGSQRLNFLRGRHGAAAHPNPSSAGC
ncbi:mannitol dehydrogenase family protein [Sesbania bispinosa]|nr:mannitol dehydrogenase family protein [Sesbania bispinosa]